MSYLCGLWRFANVYIIETLGDDNESIFICN